MQKQTTHKNKMSRKKIIILSIIILVVAFRIALPYIVLKYVNNKLANLSEYEGHVNDIDIYLFRGAYAIKDIEINKVDEKDNRKDTIPFFVSPVIDLSVQWKAIFKGRLVGELYVGDPILNFVKGKHEGEDIKADTADFRALIKDLMPLTLNHFEITNGQVHYIDLGSKPRVDVSLNDLEVVATNLSNVNDSSKVLPAHLDASGNAYEGKFEMKVDFDLLQKSPTFDMNAEITHINLVLLNSFLQAYGNFDVKKGDFGLYAEFAAKEGAFGGYVKPILKNVDIIQWNKQEGDFKQILWETLVGSGAEILQNQNKEQLASKIQINGRFDEPNINLWKAISYILRNAFVHALKPTIDNSINIKHLQEVRDKKTLLENIFGNKNKRKKKKK